jgi:hypothetical protein
LHAPQTVPSTPSEQYVAPEGGGAQVPSVPVPFWQSPEQHVLLSLHTSPVWMQNEAPSLHVPASHRLEQHWELSVHGLPAVSQAALSGWHKPALQLPPQQEAESAQAWLSAMHALALQRQAVQASEQHSVDDAQFPPGGVHWLMEATQVAEAGSQIPEQQSPPDAQVCPKARQTGEMMTSPTLGPASVVEVLPSPGGYLPTLAVLLQAAKAKETSREAREAAVGRIALGMLAPWVVQRVFGPYRMIPSRNRLQCLLNGGRKQTVRVLPAEPRRLGARLRVVALGDEGLDQQAVSLLGKLAAGIVARVMAQGRERAIDPAAGQCGTGHLDPFAFSR